MKNISDYQKMVLIMVQSIYQTNGIPMDFLFDVVSITWENLSVDIMFRVTILVKRGHLHDTECLRLKQDLHFGTSWRIGDCIGEPSPLLSFHW